MIAKPARTGEQIGRRRSRKVRSSSDAPALPRPVVLHYHLFKNAGSSVDAVLQRNFGPRWHAAEFASRAPFSNAPDVGAWILKHPRALAVSSHTARGPLPVVAGVLIAPVIFIRHPLDRIRSAYEFERGAERDGFSAVLARNTTLRGYIEVHLAAAAGRQCRNMQTAFLSGFERRKRAEIEQAMRMLERLPFVGLVEDFAGSMQRLQRYLQPYFPRFEAFEVQANMGGAQQSLPERLSDMRQIVGPVVWDKLVQANHDDLKVFSIVAESYGLPTSGLMLE